MPSERSPIWHPFTQHALAGPAIEIARAQGAHLFRADGRAIIDAISSWWVNIHGHGHPHIVRAVAEQAAKLEQVIFAGFTHEPAERLGRALLSVAPSHLAHVFFSDSGSTAVEVAIKMAVGCWHNRERPRHRIIALEHAYHGDMFGAMSVGARGTFSAAYEPMLFDVAYLPFPVRGDEQRTIDALKRLLTVAPDTFAALIVEPLVLGAGGMRMYAPAVLADIAALCRRHDVFLIADEVMTGFGRTGTLFACEQAGVAPDLMCLSKGLTGGFLPMGATLATPEIYDAFYSDDRTRLFFHSTSYTGNAIACAAACANLDIWNREPVPARIAAIADYHARALDALRARPEIVEVRQAGTIAAIELRVPDAGYFAALGPRLNAFYLERNVLLRSLGNVVYVMPPYCVGQDELDRIYETIDDFSPFSGLERRSRDLTRTVSARLAMVCEKPPLHARFLNTLSLMEHIGSRKIMASQKNAEWDRERLKHMAEEARHAHFFKRAAEKLAGGALSYGSADAIAAASAKAYMGRLDAEIARKTPNESALPYLYMSLIVELRAVWLYGIYQDVLEKHASGLTLKSVLAEEALHLASMLAFVDERDAEAADRLPHFTMVEDTRFRSLWKAIDMECARDRLAGE